MAGARQFPQRIAREGRMHDVVHRGRGVPHRKPIMMLRHESHVTEPTILERPDPLVSVELERIKALVQVVVDPPWHLYLARPTQALARQDSGAPIDESSVAVALEAPERRLVRWDQWSCSAFSRE